jgi:hypothetical protein
MKIGGGVINMQKLNNCEFPKLPGRTGFPKLAASVDAGEAARKSMLGNTRTHFAQKTNGKRRFHKIKRRERRDPLKDSFSWTWKTAHNHEQDLSLTKHSHAIHECMTNGSRCVLNNQEHNAVMQALARLADIAFIAIADLDDQHLCKLYCKHRYNFEPIAAELGLSVTDTECRWSQLTKNVSYAVREMCNEDSWLNAILADIINDKQCFHRYFMSIFGLICSECTALGNQGS